MEGLLRAHVPTMLLMIRVTSGAMAVAVLVVAWGRSSRDGLFWWGWGTFLNTAAFATFEGPDPELAYAMIDAADRALYAAKRAGRNQTCVED